MKPTPRAAQRPSPRRTVRSVVAALSLVTLPSVAAPALGSGRPIIDKIAKLRAATFLDNKDAAWFILNAPFLDTPDRVIDDTFLYRVDLMTKHFVYGSPEDGYAVTEFIDKPSWSGTYGAISCPLGLQFADLRWLRDQRVARDYARYWLHVPGAQPRRYTNWFAAAMWGLHQAWGDRRFILSMLPDMKAQYAGWEAERWSARYGMFVWDGMQDGMETNINSRQTDHPYAGDEAVRPTFNSYMFADARAIAATARLAGDTVTATAFDRRAEALRRGVEDMLWDRERRFFFPMAATDRRPAGGRGPAILAGSLTYRSGPLAGDPHGRELIGLVPWQFDLPAPGREEAWRGVLDPEVFEAPFGPTTVERHDPLFEITDKCCTWSGNSWPFATSQTLEAMANLINDYRQTVVGRDDYFRLLRTFSLTQRRDGAPFVAEAADPDTGAWQITPNHSEHYFHSSYVDLVVTGLAGLRPDARDRLIVNPLIPASWRWFALVDVPYHGHLVSIVWDADGSHYGRGRGLSVQVDGRERARSATLARIELPLRTAPPAVVDTSANYAVNHAGRGFPEVTSGSDPRQRLDVVNDGLHWYSKAPSNRWISDGGRAGPVSVDLDLGTVRRIDRLRLYLVDDGPGSGVEAPTAVNVMLWREGAGWQRATSKTPVEAPMANAPTDVRFATPMAVRRLRVTFQAHNGSAVGISEIEAWGPPPRLEPHDGPDRSQ